MSTPAKTSISFAGALAVANKIKGATATVAGPQSYPTNGTITGTFTTRRTVTATLAAHASSYVDGSTITFTGTNETGAVVEVLTIVGTGGGTTLKGSKDFLTVTKIDVQAQADTSGSFQFGVSDAFASARQVRVGTTGDLHVGYADGSSDTIPKVQAGEQVPGEISRIYGDSTAQDITIYI